jgi:glycosyltransferase involved in cell wall biosynthesis
MRLGFHYHIPACQINGKIYTASYLGLFLDGLAMHVTHMVLFLHSPRADEQSQMDYEILADNVILVALPEHLSIPRRLLIGRSLGRKVAKAVQGLQLDLILFRAPTPILPFLVKATQGLCKHALLVVGDLREHVDNLGQPWWRAGLVRRYIYWNEGQQEQLARKMLVFTNSAVFFERYKRIAQKALLVRTTTLSRSDFFERAQLNTGKPFKILYAGRIEAGKGLLLIAEAVVLLNQQGIGCHWDIVGWSEPGNDTPEQIQAIFEQAKLGQMVVFHGKKKVGEELFGYYRKTDAYVMASLLSEGFPRTIWEAMASSTPVIATPVGSIPFYLKHEKNALLVKPDSEDIMAKIRQLAESVSLRNKLIRNGLETVSESTLEFQSEKMALAINQYLQAS